MSKGHRDSQKGNSSTTGSDQIRELCPIWWGNIETSYLATRIELSFGIWEIRCVTMETLYVLDINCFQGMKYGEIIV